MHAIRLAAVAGQSGQDGLAERVLQQALPRDTDGAVHFMLAQLYVAQGRAAEARRNAEIAAERRQDVDGYLLLRSTCEAVGDRAAASEALRKAKRLAPNDPRLGGHPEPS
jgi:predicted Zn-dependent protease